MSNTEATSVKIEFDANAGAMMERIRTLNKAINQLKANAVSVTICPDST